MSSSVIWLQQMMKTASGPRGSCRTGLPTPRRSSPALIKSLGDVEADVRRSAAIGLGYYGAKAKEAISALEEKQNDPDARVREAAKTAISRIKNQ